RQLIGAAELEFYQYVLTDNEALLLESVLERVDPCFRRLTRPQEADAVDLAGPSSKRRQSGASNQRHELPPPHSTPQRSSSTPDKISAPGDHCCTAIASPCPWLKRVIFPRSHGCTGSARPRQVYPQTSGATLLRGKSARKRLMHRSKHQCHSISSSAREQR